MKLIETIKKKKKFWLRSGRGRRIGGRNKGQSSSKKQKSVEDKCDNKRNCVLYQK